jgi:hypothetical protein
MIRLLGAAALLASLIPAGAQAQDIKAMAMFGGNEVTILYPNIVNEDCTSPKLPDVRMQAQPANGTVRMEPTTITLNRPRNDPRSTCNGKKVDAMAVYYKANEGFVGVERLVVRADFRSGNVREFVVLLDVR